MKLQLDEWQKEVLECKGNIALRSGRQVGKSTVISVLAGDYAATNKNKIVLVIASVERQAYEIYSKILSYMEDYHKKLLKKGKQFNTKSKMELMNGTKIYCLPTGLTGHGIRGYTVDLLIADEAAFIPRLVWDSIVPSMAARIKLGARMVLLSTPFGRDNYFYDCFDDDDFSHFHVSSEECPRMDKDWLKKREERMSKIAYAQEFKGEFADGQMQWFNDELIRECQVLERLPVREPNKNYYLGSDIARMGNDKSTFEIMEEVDGVMLHREHMTTEKSFLNETFDMILDLDKKWQFEKMFIDNEGIGVGVFDFLVANDQTKTRTFGVNNSMEIKQGLEKKRIKIAQEELYTNLLSLMRQGKVKLLDDEEIFFSLRAMQFDYTTDGLGRSHLKIFARHHTDSDIAEGLIRSVLGEKYKDINITIHTIKV